MLSDQCKCTLAAGSLITVTRSCGICTRFPFTLSRAPEGSAARQTMKGTCCFIFSFRFIVSHCIQKRKVLFVCSAEFFRPSWASLQPPVQNLTQAFHIQRLGGMLVHTGGFGRLHILGKGVGRHGDDGDALRFRMVRGADEPRWANRKLEKPSHREKLFDG